MRLEPTYQETLQRHHDHYVDLEIKGELKPEDRVHYDLAMERERDGIVKALVTR